jgi:hypothetical protein
MNTFKANKRLPPDIIIHSAETHMFRIGLSLFENESAKRTKLHNPVFITLVNTISLMRCIISLLLPQENEKPFIIIGDFSYFLGIRIHFNLAYGLYILLALTSQLLHYINYKNDIKPIYLKPFEMMSGLISPQSIGLTNRDEIYKLIKLSKLTFFVCRFNADITIAVSTFTLNILPFIINCSILDIILFGIPHSILFCCCCHFIFNINLWKFTYFYLVCNYLKIKLREVNNELTNKIGKRIRITNAKTIGLIKKLSSIYSEIDDYNNNFWSKYLLSIWLIFGSVINTTLYLTVFGEMHIICRIVFAYGVCIFVITFTFIVNTASSVTLEAMRSYKLLNNLMVSNANTYSKVYVMSNLNNGNFVKIKVIKN